MFTERCAGWLSLDHWLWHKLGYCPRNAR